MMEEMRKDLINMLNWKRAAVERIAVESEKISSQYNYGQLSVHARLCNAINLLPPGCRKRN